MALTGINAMPYDLSALSAQISDSVRNIKAKAAVVPQNVGSSDNSAGTYTAQPFSLNSYAVSYLEPFSLYSVQKIVSEAAEEMPEQNRRQLRPDGETAEKKAAESAHYIGGFGFAEELAQVASAADYAKAAAIYGQRFSINVPEVNWLFGGNADSENQVSYAARAYHTAAELNREKEPLIDFMHEYNRNFDYKI